MWGLEHSDLIVSARKTVHSRLSQYNVGFPIAQIWNPNIHVEVEKYLDSAEGIYRAATQMKWLSRGVRQGFPNKGMILTLPVRVKRSMKVPRPYRSI